MKLQMGETRRFVPWIIFAIAIVAVYSFILLPKRQSAPFLYEFAAVSAQAVTVFQNGSSTMYVLNDSFHPYPSTLKLDVSGVSAATASPLKRMVTATSVQDLTDSSSQKEAWDDVGTDRRLSLVVFPSGTYQITADKVGDDKKPTPPSTIQKWMGDRWEDVATEKNHIYHTMVIGKDGQLAVTLEDGSAHVLVNRAWVQLGNIQPLLFVDSTHLIGRDGFVFKLWDLSSMQMTNIGTLPPGDVSIHATIKSL